MAAAGIIQVIARQVGRQPGQDAPQAAVVQILPNLVQRQIGQAVAVQCRIADQVDAGQDQRALDPDAGFPAAASRSACRWSAAAG